MKLSIIVKVNVSTFSSDGVSRVLIYDESRVVYFEGQTSKTIKKLMKGQLKKYFTAQLKGTVIVLDKEVKPQNW